MSVKCSVDYYGPSINSSVERFNQYDLACPNVCKDGKKNFWKSRCINRIGNKDIPSCYKGCKEAAKYPELKAKMDKVIAIWEKEKKKRDLHDKQQLSEFNRLRYLKGVANARKNPKITQKDRAKIIQMYLNAQTVNETVLAVGCGRTAISMYRKMYREGAITKAGKITI